MSRLHLTNLGRIESSVLFWRASALFFLRSNRAEAGVAVTGRQREPLYHPCPRAAETLWVVLMRLRVRPG